MDTAVKRCSYVPEVQICTVGQETKGGPMKSESIAALAKALSAAQADYNALIKDSENPFFRSKYADLAACLDSVKDALKAHGLAVIQTTDITEAGNVKLITTLAHESGEWITGEYPVMPIKADPQGYGAAMTYARRYCLQAILGLAAEDDDGETASGRQEKKPAQAKAPVQQAQPPLPAPAPATQQAPAAPAKPANQMVTGLVEAVTSKPTKNGGTRYGINIGGTYYNTFDTKLGGIAQDAKNRGIGLMIEYVEYEYMPGTLARKVVALSLTNNPQPAGDADGLPF